MYYAKRQHIYSTKNNTIKINTLHCTAADHKMQRHKHAKETEKNVTKLRRNHPHTVIFSSIEVHGSDSSALLHCALSLAAQCIVIGPVCLFVGVFVGLLPRKLKLRALIFTKLGLR